MTELELELQTVHLDATSFQAEYMHAVGPLLVRLDELRAEIAKIQALRTPTPEAQEAFNDASQRAEDTSSAYNSILGNASETTGTKSQALKDLYRAAAKAVHPDLANDERERSERERLMAEANQAYADGDEDRLRSIIREWQTSPEAIAGRRYWS